MRQWVKILHHLEDGLLLILLLAMIGLGAWQMLLRNLFDSSYTWIDPLLRMLVLWVGLVGAMVATRQKRHISVDALTRWIPKSVQPALKALSTSIAFVVTAVLAYTSARFVEMDFEVGSIAFAGVPNWICELILPFSFFCIMGRFFFYSIQNLQALWRARQPRNGAVE